METLRSQHNTSIWEHQSDHNKILVYGNTSQIKTNYKYLEKVRSQQIKSIWKHHTDHNKIPVFANTNQITTKHKYLGTPLRLHQMTSFPTHQSDQNEIPVFGNTSQIKAKYKYWETPGGLQQNPRIWKQSAPKKIQVFRNSQITTKSKYLETVRLLRNTSIWKHQTDNIKKQEYQSDHNQMQVFANTSRITTKYKYLETVRSQQNSSI